MVVARIRRYLALGVAAAIAVSAAGCSVPSETAAKLIEGQFVFVSCEAFTFKEISVVAHDYDNWAADHVSAWIASGAGLVRPGDPVIYGSPPRGFETDVGPILLPLTHHRIEVDLSSSSDSVWGIFDSRRLSPDYCLRNDGSRHDAPCDV